MAWRPRYVLRFWARTRFLVGPLEHFIMGSLLDKSTPSGSRRQDLVRSSSTRVLRGYPLRYPTLATARLTHTSPVLDWGPLPALRRRPTSQLELLSEQTSV